MSQQQPLKVQELLDKAARDPDLLQRFADDPLGTAQAEGVKVDVRHLKTLLGMPEATDQELVEVLRQRTSHAATSCMPMPGCV